MINKAVGYSGFRTYGELPYPTIKQGKQLQLANKVWQATVREVDHSHPLENYHNKKSIYTKSYLQNTFPQHYHPDHVKKGTHQTLKFQNTGVVKAYDKQQALKYGGTQYRQGIDDPRKGNLLKTGTQHWKSIYQNTIAGDAQNRNYGLTGTGNNYSALRVSGQGQPAKGGQSGQNNGLNNNNSQMNQTGNRSQSLGGKSQTQLAQQMARANSYKNKPYINNARTGITDYKFNYGQKIGDSPLDIMNVVSVKQPLRDHPLKRGTNQLWTQIPNYQGFKPAQLPFRQYEKKILNRNEVDKGNLKLQTAQNFLVQTPGYGGFKPQFQKTATNLRESCLSTKFGNQV